MKRMRAILLAALWLAMATGLFSQESFYATVHFIHGSRPKMAFRETEKRWFGGVLGGHVGIEFAPGQVVDFSLRGRVRVFPRPGKIRGEFAIMPVEKFWMHFPNPPGDLKRTNIQIPINFEQKRMLDSLAHVFEKDCPHDYAFFGMRCASTSYELLMQAGLVEKRARPFIIARNFYPKKLRRTLEKMAAENGWLVQKTAGTSRRRWDRG